MTRSFFTPARIALLNKLEAGGLRQHEIARELGCGIHTLIRHRKRQGTVSETKQRAGKAGARKRWGYRHGHP